ncbi:uncharacterized protein LOC122930622 isoform X2 [Bufo gargarizans]|uniref:uncharacterized protein LOC122930622 isoform X2 n=1 Tax=Bufo gargarizans TaxID=30331 RepID=UPI001CF3C77B|nr:uncharacterized protein LOC122930622 isoform X2 [Bufo gargarizans]
MDHITGRRWSVVVAAASCATSRLVMEVTKMMAAALSTVTSGVLIILAVLLLSSEGHYVQRGSDITSCSIKCPDEKSVLSLYTLCGGNETLLAERWCDDKWSGNVTEPRFLLDTSSGCWTLTGAEKSDSCRYNLWLHNSSGGFLHSTDVTVLDPVLITSITSNSSRLGEDIAVSVHFSGEETAVAWEVDGGRLLDRYHLIDDNRTLIILRAQKDDAGRRLGVRITNPVSNKTLEHQLQITDPGQAWILICGVSAAVIGFLILLIVVQRRKKMKLNHSEEHGRLSSSSPDADREEDGAEESHEHYQQTMKESQL